MKKLFLLLLCLALASGCATNRGKDRKRSPRGPAKKSIVVSTEDGYRVSRNFEAVSVFRNWADGRTKLVIGTRAGHLHIMDFGPAGLRLEWESPYLGAPVRGVMVRDFRGTGRSEIMVYTAGGRLFMLGMDDYSIDRENAAFDMPQISCVVAVQLDDDPALELLACGGDRFAVYDASTLFKEWEAPGVVPGKWLATGDVDGDGVLEVVLNSGYVLDAKFFRIESQLRYLGERIELIDVDGDGVDEIIAESEAGTVSIFDGRMPGIPEY